MCALAHGTFSFRLAFVNNQHISFVFYPVFHLKNVSDSIVFEKKLHIVSLHLCIVAIKKHSRPDDFELQLKGKDISNLSSIRTYLNYPTPPPPPPPATTDLCLLFV